METMFLPLAVLVAAGVRDAPGSAITVTPADTFDYLARWSPDGSKIVFTSMRDGHPQIYVMNADGSAPIRLTTSASSVTDENPSWSPDGSRIAFRSDRDGNSEIYIMNADGSDQERLTQHPSYDGETPAWSPNGAKIAFYSKRDGNDEIYVMDADGSNSTRLTREAGNDTVPAWSPDGSRILFSSDRNGRVEIFVMNADGSSQARLTRATTRDDYPAWSPDGSQILFISNRENFDWDIYIMKADGTQQRRLAQARDWDFDPSFSADGKRVLFDSRRDGRRGIYVMNTDGSNLVKLTNLAVNPLITLFRAKGVKAGLQSYRQRKKTNPGEVVFLEAEIRNLAFEYFDSGQLEEAITLFRLNTEAHPASVSAYSRLSDACKRAGRKAPPSEIEFLGLISDKGVAYGRQIYQEVKRSHPKWLLFSEFRIMALGANLLKNGQLDEGLAVFRLALQDYPKSAGLHDSVGESYLRMGNKELAIKSYRRSLDLDSNNTNAKEKLKLLAADQS